MSIPLRMLIAVAARAARRTVPPYPATHAAFEPDDARAIGLAEAAAAGVPIDRFILMGAGGGRFVFLVELCGLAEAVRREGSGARVGRSGAIESAAGFIRDVAMVDGEARDPITEWAQKCILSDINLALREVAEDDDAVMRLGSAVDAGAGGLFGQLWPWELGAWEHPGELFQPLMPNMQRQGISFVVSGHGLRRPPRDGMVSWYFGEGLHRREAEEVIAKEEAWAEIVLGVDLVVYADTFEAGLEDALIARGITVLTRESFPGRPPADERSLLMKVGQSFVHAQLGIGPDHSPIQEATLSARALGVSQTFSLHEDEPPEPDDGYEASEESVLEWIASELTDHPGPRPDDGPSFDMGLRPRR